MIYRFSRFFIFLIAVSGMARVAAQPFPKDYFRAPLDIPITLAGCFGELRTNHFHTGIDIKTDGKQGQPVHAAADGFISRIGVSGSGYGNALYIDHPNGYTTVYGHLRNFNPALQAYVRQKQYASQSFDQDFKLDPRQFPVKKGDIIAYSGNTGNSGGPHLHFEIRDTKSENPINPLLFGFMVGDTIPPVIHAIKIYPLDSGSYVKALYTNGRRGTKMLMAVVGQNIKLEVYKDGHTYHLKNIAQLQAQGNIGFSIEANDYEDSSYNKIGVYSIELCVNEEEIFRKTMNRLDFDLKRYINTDVDYAERLKTRRWFEKSFVSLNNELPIYSNLKNRGILQARAGNIYHVNYYLNDVKFNTAELAFDITSPVEKQELVLPPKDYDTLLSFQKANHINKGNIYMNIPRDIFYENVPFTYSELPERKHTFSKVYCMGNPAFPCQDYFEMGIKAEHLPARLHDKACILSYSTGYQGGEYDNGWIKTKARTLGRFFVSADTIAPQIIPLNIRNGRNMAYQPSIRFVIRDNMSGVKNVRGTIDGHWVLFEYDAKASLYYYTFDQEHCPPGKHTLVMSATDEKDNTRTVKLEFRN